MNAATLSTAWGIGPTSFPPFKAYVPQVQIDYPALLSVPGSSVHQAGPGDPPSGSILVRVVCDDATLAALKSDSKYSGTLVVES